MAVIKTTTRPLPNDARNFEIRGKALGGGPRGTEVNAVDERGVPKATLIIVVLQQRKVKIAVRELQVLDDSGGKVFHAGRRFDIPKLVHNMNLIWAPQANIVFDLVSSNPVLVDDEKAIAKAMGLKADRAKLPELVNTLDFDDMFAKLKEPKAEWTFFIVRRVVQRMHDHPNAAIEPALGATALDHGIVWLGADMDFSTMAHEAGHALGHPGHTERDPKHPDPRPLMNNGGPGIGVGKIFFRDVVQIFNKGYQ
jgi:hypothetical protein